MTASPVVAGEAGASHVPAPEAGGGAVSKPAAEAQVPTTYPWLGVASVLIGVSISVFFGQFLASGLPDLRGAQGLSADQGAWLGAVFNAGQMFIGPLCVFLGGVFGPRRILLVATVFIFCAAALLPFAASFGAILSLLAICGLAAGCFYPLTLTFIMRGLPPKLVLFGVACYTIDVISSVHLATAIQSWYYLHLGWRWLYWHFAVLAPFMALLVYFGIPKQTPKPSDEQQDGKKREASWRGFLYLSFGLTLIFLALTQGERLNWLHSGTIVALFVSGGFLVAASVIRHFQQPLPLVDFAILRRRNIILLSFCLIILRYTLLSSASIVPSFLTKVQGYRPEEIAPALAVVAVPMAVFGLGAALSLRFIDPRILLACGFTLMAAACLWDHRLTSAWNVDNFRHTELFLGVGLALMINGLIGNIVLAAINGGAVKIPIRALTVAGWFHCVRLLGGEIASALLSRLLDVREKFHSNVLGQSVSLTRPGVVRQIESFTLGLLPQSALSGVAQARAVALISSRIAKQAFTLACADSYMVFSIVLTVGLVLVACLKKEPIGFAQLLAPKKEGK